MSKWISVETDLPEQMKEVDIWTNNGLRVPDVVFDGREEGEKYFYDEGFDNIYEINEVSHWMNPPEPPEDIK
ncbi:MAG: DUF551 domain-containing protein [Deltaproteobacteria bacterium]|nr:DUF551 domain-containing protein [Deltaproteobacteria bacterium]